jgi:hypothetical protein
VLCGRGVIADGMMVAPKSWDGTIEEFAQDAIVIFHGSETKGEATEDLILKVGVKGDAKQFAWVIPFPAEPQTFKEDPALFNELYFPMKMTGLQKEPFDVNLYVFYRFWLNDHKSKYGYEHRGFTLVYRDWDTPACEPNGGKSYSAPARDPFLKNLAARIPTVTKLIQKLHPGERYYLTNLRARALKPDDVRQWPDDLWLFPYYTDPAMVPYDAHPGECASGAYR